LLLSVPLILEYEAGNRAETLRILGRTGKRKQARRELKEVGWTKGLELAKVARRDGQEFDCATWLHKARSLPKDQFKREVEKELTRRESERWEIIYFKLYKSQIPVVEQAIETAALMLGSASRQIAAIERADVLAAPFISRKRKHELHDCESSHKVRFDVGLSPVKSPIPEVYYALARLSIERFTAIAMMEPNRTESRGVSVPEFIRSQAA
jgi:hypothetical protein